MRRSVLILFLLSSSAIASQSEGFKGDAVEGMEWKRELCIRKSSLFDDVLRKRIVEDAEQEDLMARIRDAKLEPGIAHLAANQVALAYRADLKKCGWVGLVHAYYDDCMGKPAPLEECFK